MRRVLAIDTSGPWGGVALVERADGASDPVTVAELGMRLDRSHAAHLLGSIERALRIAGWDRSSPDEFVAVRGPGSFTGLRVGLGTARGLALASGRPCYGVGTLPATAEAFGAAATERLVLLDAGRGEIYAARFDADHRPPVPVRAPFRCREESELIEGQAGVTLIHSPSLEERMRALEADKRVACRAPAPSSIAGAAGRLRLLQPPHDPPPEPFAPLYLRPPDAELKPRPR